MFFIEKNSGQERVIHGSMALHPKEDSRMKNPDLYAEPMTEKHMDEIREFAMKNESMEDLLRRLVATVEKGGRESRRTGEHGEGNPRHCRRCKNSFWKQVLTMDARPC